MIKFYTDLKTALIKNDFDSFSNRIDRRDNTYNRNIRQIEKYFKIKNTHLIFFTDIQLFENNTQSFIILDELRIKHCFLFCYFQHFEYVLEFKQNYTEYVSKVVAHISAAGKIYDDKTFFVKDLKNLQNLEFLIYNDYMNKMLESAGSKLYFNDVPSEYE